MIKRFFSLFLVLLLALSCAAACAEGSDWDLAYSLMEKYTGYSRDQVRPGQLLYEDDMLSFSVILKDAYTGALMERPMTDYIPMEFHCLDFLIRTNEAVESIRDL